MKGPIQYAMSYPKRLELKQAKRLNLWEIGTLHFEKVDFERFRSLYLAYEAGKAGGTMPTVLNAANEVAVQQFLEGRITFLEIEALVEQALSQHEKISLPDLETIIAVDQETRKRVSSGILI
jgi:1-deoxy-D-xylulose-5-phosphate reductoisomerase